MVKRYNKQAFSFKDLDGKDIRAYAHTTDTRQGFCHTVETWDDKEELAKVKVSYLNRTWERFDYESALLSVIEKAFTGKRNELIREYLRKQVDDIANGEAKKAEEWFNKMKSAYEGLSDSTKNHIINAVDGRLLDKDGIEFAINAGKALDAIESLVK